MNVLVTGANGTVGTALREHLEGHEVTWFDVAGHSEYETTIGDTTDYDAVREVMDEQDAVVHLAMTDFLGGPGDRSLAWSEGFAANCREICNVLEAARDADVDSVVYASSNHAVGMYEVEHAPEIYDRDYDLVVDHTVPPRPDSRYGAVKVFGEAMGRLAAETHDLRFYALRICTVHDPEYDHPYGDAERGVENGEFERDSDAYEEQVARQKCMWHSRRDAAHLVDCCVRDESVEFDVFYGRSESERAWLDVDHAKEVVGYEPRDDASEWDAPPER